MAVGRNVLSRVATAIARWAVLLAAVTLAVLYLNSAAYSAWAGGGPPTTIREAWMQRALADLCYALATTLGGLALFRTIRRTPRLDRVVVVLTVLALVLLAAPRARRFLLVDHCLDAGGRWDDAAFRCQR